MPNQEMEQWLVKLDPVLQESFQKQYEGFEALKNFSPELAGVAEASELLIVKAIVADEEKTAASATKPNADAAAVAKGTPSADDYQSFVMGIGGIIQTTLDGAEIPASVIQTGHPLLDQPQQELFDLTAKHLQDGSLVGAWKKLEKTIHALFQKANNQTFPTKSETKTLQEVIKSTAANFPKLDDYLVLGAEIDLARRKGMEPDARPQGRSPEAESKRISYGWTDEPKALKAGAWSEWVEMTSNLEWAVITDAATARVRQKIGHPVESGEDLLEWLVMFDDVKARETARLNESLAKLKEGIQLVEISSQNYMQDNYQSTGDAEVAMVSEFAGGAVQMRSWDFSRAYNLHDAAKAAVAEGNFASAYTAIELAFASYTAIESNWNAFIKKAHKGAGRAIIGLTIVKEGAKAFVIGVATGGLSEAAEATGVVKAVIGAGVGAGVSIAGAMWELGRKIVNGTAKDFDINEEVADVLKDAAFDVAGGAVGEWLGGGLSTSLEAALTKRIGPLVGDEAAGLAATAVNTAIQAAGETVARTAVKVSIDVFIDNGKMYHSSAEFLQDLGKEYAENVFSDVAGGLGEDLGEGAVRDQKLLDFVTAALTQGK